MADGIYVAFSGALGRARQLEVLSGNLANMDTPGYREMGLTFSSAMRQALDRPSRQDGVGSASPRALPMDKHHLQATESYVRLDRGSLTETGNSLDLAVEPDGYLLVGTPAGAAALPSGSFTVARDGKIIDTQGNPLLDRAGQPIQVPVGQEVAIDEDGLVTGDGEALGTVALVRLVGSPTKIGSSYLTGELVPLDPGESQVKAGWRESSNVDPLASLTGMIEVHRSFESLEQVIQAYRQMDRQAVADVGKKSG